MRLPVKADLLPHLIANGDKVMCDTYAPQHGKFSVAGGRARRVERIVEDDRACARRDRALNRLLLIVPVGRGKAHKDRRRAAAADHRRISIISRLKDDHVIARLDQSEKGGRNGLGRARSDDHLLAGER